jgi:hypothetical protein
MALTVERVYLARRISYSQHPLSTQHRTRRKNREENRHELSKSLSLETHGEELSFELNAVKKSTMLNLQLDDFL